MLSARPAINLKHRLFEKKKKQFAMSSASSEYLFEIKKTRKGQKTVYHAECYHGEIFQKKTTSQKTEQFCLTDC